MEQKPFTVQAQLTGFRYTVDRCVSLSFHTCELSNIEKTAIGEYHQKDGWLLFSLFEVEEKDIPPDNKRVYEDKTPGQRLRGVLFALYAKQGGKSETFQAYYDAEMAKITEHYKRKIDELTKEYQ
jgi:hypothetical protein